MADEKLNFNPDDLNAFDRAPTPADDLSAFDSASGVSVLPPGWYLCRLEAGDLITTRTGKPAFRLRFSVREPEQFAAFPLWRYLLLDAPSAGRSKAALEPLGLRTSADLRRCPFPAVGRVILCRVLVGVQKNDPSRNEVERFTVEREERDEAAVANRFLLDPNGTTPEGGQP